MRRLIALLACLLCIPALAEVVTSPGPGLSTGVTGLGPIIVQGQNWSSWGNYGATLGISGYGFTPTNCPVMGGQSTPSNQATYGSFDRVVLCGGIYNNSLGAQITGVTFGFTDVFFSTAQPCALFHARVGNVTGGTNISVNNNPNFVGEVTNVNCVGTTTTDLSIGGGWFQQVGSYASSATLVNGGSGCNNGDVLYAKTGRGYAWPLSVTVTNCVGGVIQPGGYTFTGGSYQQGAYFQPVTATAMVDATTPAESGATFTFGFTNVAAQIGSGQIPTGNAIIYNPNTKIWYDNPVCNMTTPPGNTVGMATLLACREMDVNNNTGVDDYFVAGGNYTGGMWGLDIVNLGANIAGNAILCRGKWLACFLAGDGNHIVEWGHICQPLNGQSPAPICVFSTQQAGTVLSAQSAATGTNLILNQFGANAERTDQLDDKGTLSLGAQNNGTIPGKVNLYSSGTAQGSWDVEITSSGGSGTGNGTAVITAATEQVSGLVSCTGIQTNGSGTFSCTASDARVKVDEGVFSPYDDLAYILTAPRDHKFEFRDGYGPEGVHYGFFAQDVMSFDPALVHRGPATEFTPDGELQTDKAEIEARTPGAIKGLQYEVDGLGASVLALIGWCSFLTWGRRKCVHCGQRA